MNLDGGIRNGRSGDIRSLAELGSAFGSLGSSLKTFVINLYGQSDMTHLPEFFKGMKSLTKLQTLEINLHGCCRKDNGNLTEL